MKLFYRYLNDHLSLYVLLFLVVLIFDCLLILCDISINLLIYPNVVILVIIVFYSLVAYYKYKQKHLLLSKEFYSEISDEKLFDEDYKIIIENLNEKIKQLETEYHKSNKMMLDYYSLWVHQIKTPIAAMQLSLESEDSPLSRKLMLELLHIEQYVDMVLTYQKVDDSSDYVFEEISLDVMIKDAIRYLRLDFIERKISLKYETIDKIIITDKKWFEFVLKQLISNALKYSQKGTICIYLEDEYLCIKDEGIGIRESDLKRIFEKGYTGYNGHDNKSSSGIGLYLCLNIISNLGLKLSVTSTVSVGSIFKIYLKQDEKAKD